MKVAAEEQPNARKGSLSNGSYLVRLGTVPELVQAEEAPAAPSSKGIFAAPRRAARAAMSMALRVLPSRTGRKTKHLPTSPTVIASKQEKSLLLDARGVKAWHALSAHYDGLPFHVSAPSSQSSSSCGSSSSGRSVSSGRSSASSSPPDPVVSRDSVRGESRVALFQPRRAAWDSEIEPEEKLFCRREPQNRAAHGRGRAPPRIDVMGAS